jgi:hypothetical protein
LAFRKAYVVWVPDEGGRPTYADDGIPAWAIAFPDEANGTAEMPSWLNEAEQWDIDGTVEPLEIEPLDSVLRRAVCEVQVHVASKRISPARDVHKASALAKVALSSLIIIRKADTVGVCQVTNRFPRIILTDMNSGEEIPSWDVCDVMAFQLERVDVDVFLPQCEAMLKERLTTERNAKKPQLVRAPSQQREVPQPQLQDRPAMAQPLQNLQEVVDEGDWSGDELSSHGCLQTGFKYSITFKKNGRTFTKTGTATKPTAILWEGASKPQLFPPSPGIEITKMEQLDHNAATISAAKDRVSHKDVSTWVTLIRSLEGHTILKEMLDNKYYTRTCSRRAQQVDVIMEWVLSAASTPRWVETPVLSMGRLLLRELRIMYDAFAENLSEDELRREVTSREEGTDEYDRAKAKLKQKGRTTNAVPGKGGKPRFSGVCNFCHLKGHKEAECFKKKKATQSTVPKTNTVPGNRQGGSS